MSDCVDASARGDRSVMMMVGDFGPMMADLGQLLGVGVEMGGLGVGYLWRVDDAAVVGQRSRGPVVGVMLGLGVVVGNRVVGDLVVALVGQCGSVMRHLGELLVVGVEVGGFGVGDLGGVDDAPVVGQRCRWAMVRRVRVHVWAVVVAWSGEDRHCEG